MWHHVIPCELMWPHVIPCDLMWYHVSSCDLMWYHVSSCDTMWPHVTSCDTCDLVWYHVSSCDTMWAHVVPCELMWPHVIPCDLMWYHVSSCNRHVHHVTLWILPSPTIYWYRSLWCGAGQLPYKESSTRTAARVSRQFEKFCHPLSHPWIPEVARLPLEATLSAQWSESRYVDNLVFWGLQIL